MRVKVSKYSMMALAVIVTTVLLQLFVVSELVISFSMLNDTRVVKANHASDFY